MSTYEIRATQLTVLPVGESLFSEMATRVTVVDEAGGEFVEVSQEGRTDLGKIAIDRSEWPTLRDAIDRAIEACKSA